MNLRSGALVCVTQIKNQTNLRG